MRRWVRIDAEDGGRPMVAPTAEFYVMRRWVGMAAEDGGRPMVAPTAEFYVICLYNKTAPGKPGAVIVLADANDLRL